MESLAKLWALNIIRGRRTFDQVGDRYKFIVAVTLVLNHFPDRVTDEEYRQRAEEYLAERGR